MKAVEYHDGMKRARHLIQGNQAPTLKSRSLNVIILLESNFLGTKTWTNGACIDSTLHHITTKFGDPLLNGTACRIVLMIAAPKPLRYC
mmetsp:Transcript_3352/g.4999  ORF Transcript_3352/g.4999 Transcript_3352/m.4999 type:complete len:89 (-) Transcript_3352:1457-1723(-)